MIRDWLPVARNHNLIFRIAVREVESWLLADRIGFAKFLGIARDKLPKNPDDLIDPKAHLINLTRISRKRDLREDILPRIRSTAKQGPAYNERLVSFVRDAWNPSKASEYSPSLGRTLKALEVFAPIWEV
jgi:chorismate mutase